MEIIEWEEIKTAPKDGTEILAYREGAGVFLVRYTSPYEFLSDSECDKLGVESVHKFDWFFADFVYGGRLDGDLIPTHWMPLPKPPNERPRNEQI